MKKILTIVKEPFLDRIPSLKTLILDLCEKDCMVTLLTSRSKRFSGLSTSHKNLKVVTIDERSKKFESPTTFKILMKSLSVLLANKFDYIIGGDAWGNIIASKLKCMYSCPHVFFALEFPQIVTADHPILSQIEKWENNALQTADYIITHDEYHKKFICENFTVNEDNILLLANASFTPEFRYKSRFLHQKFNLPSDSYAILHSGGFGEWFRCLELADISKNWPSCMKLIFHIGRIPSDSKEFDLIYNKSPYKNINFSLDALSNNQLDEMISSADVGIALYSIESLGYRAELMGLAAGKIGNYLKCGLPVIATKMPSLKYIEDYSCGILINNENEIEEAVRTIVTARESYRENAFRCYRELWHPNNYLPMIHEKLMH